MQTTNTARSQQDESGEEHHCPDHARFTPSCESCCRARAAFLPYPVKEGKAPVRSFGYKDQMTPEMISGLTKMPRNWRVGLLKFVVNLFVPFVWR